MFKGSNVKVDWEEHSSSRSNGSKGRLLGSFKGSRFKRSRSDLGGNSRVSGNPESLEWTSVNGVGLSKSSIKTLG